MIRYATSDVPVVVRRMTSEAPAARVVTTVPPAEPVDVFPPAWIETEIEPGVETFTTICISSVVSFESVHRSASAAPLVRTPQSCVSVMVVPVVSFGSTSCCPVQAIVLPLLDDDDDDDDDELDAFASTLPPSPLLAPELDALPELDEELPLVVFVVAPPLMSSSGSISVHAPKMATSARLDPRERTARSTDRL